MARRLKLDIGSDTIYRMLGITTTLSDYRLAYYLSGASRLSFSQEGEIITQLSSGILSLPVFAARDRRNALYYFLIPNKKDGLVLFPTERRFDYWLLVGGDGEPMLSDLGRTLQRNSHIQFCYEMDTSRLKESEGFFVDVELGTMDILHRWKGRLNEEDTMW